MALVLRQLLAMAGPDSGLVNAKDKHEWAPLHILASGGSEPDARGGMIRQLCHARAGEHQGDDTPFCSWLLRRHASS